MQASFKNKVTKFWKHFVEEESAIREMMNYKIEGKTLLNFVDNILQIAFNKVHFEMGINSEGKYELILSPEGDRTLLMLTNYWLGYVPPNLSERWNFYSARPARGNPDTQIKTADIQLNEDDILLYPQPQKDNNKINLKVYSPKLMSLEEGKRYPVFLVYIDQFIGELYTMEYIGHIDFVNEEITAQSMSPVSLKSFIDSTIDIHNWPRFDNRNEIYYGYRMEPSKEKDWILRDDIFSGYTSCMPILTDFYNKESKRFDDAKANGVLFGFVFFENFNIRQQDIVNVRGEIEDKITDRTDSYGIATCLGGATGLHFSYIDFIIYDQEAFLHIAKSILSTYTFEETGYCDLTIDANPSMFD